MNDIPEHIQIKLQNSKEYVPRIMSLCLKEVSYPRVRQRKGIGVCLGEMTQALRSALNNAIWDFAERNLKLTLDGTEYEKIQYSHDFPIERDKESFEESRTRILRHIADSFPRVYQFLETAQPYHVNNQYLWSLKIISNSTTHTIPIEAQTVQGNDVAFVNGKPRIVSNQVIMSTYDSSYRRVYPSIPCYVEELKMFVSKKRKWVLFFINLGKEPKPNLMPFVETANLEVDKLISEFYTLW
ncbi:MAG: hypothetical protein JXR84_09170 [Anaerolineae bacterium]|nr:hypothetical protein [Anaerolineae bacterium]